LAHQAGLHVIVQADELEDLIRFYERRGYFNEMLELLEDGLHQENSHPSLKTELALLYSKYSPQKLMKHIQTYHETITIPKVAAVVDKNQQWSELCFLYTKYGEFDKAINCMIKHSADAWDHISFKDTIVRVSNIDLYDEGLKFYANEQPTLVNDYLKAIANVAENRRVVSTAKKNGWVALIKPYLQFVQEKNVHEINEALNELYIEEEDYESLLKSVNAFDNFDSLALAKKLKGNDLLEFRRIAAHLYRVSLRLNGGFIQHILMNTIIAQWSMG
jgi:clathrin heavy chain